MPSGRRPYLKLFQDFISLSPIFTKVFDLLALGTAAVMFHFGALGVYFGTLRLVAHGAVLSTLAGAVRVPGEETLSEFVHEATVVDATLPSVVVENNVIVGRSVGFIRRVILGCNGGRENSGIQGEEDDTGRWNRRAHLSPRYSYTLNKRSLAVSRHSQTRLQCTNQWTEKK